MPVPSPETRHHLPPPCLYLPRATPAETSRWARRMFDMDMADGLRGRLASWQFDPLRGLCIVDRKFVKPAKAVGYDGVTDA